MRSDGVLSRPWGYSNPNVTHSLASYPSPRFIAALVLALGQVLYLVATHVLHYTGNDHITRLCHLGGFQVANRNRQQASPPRAELKESERAENVINR